MFKKYLLFTILSFGLLSTAFGCNSSAPVNIAEVKDNDTTSSTNQDDPPPLPPSNTQNKTWPRLRIDLSESDRKLMDAVFASDIETVKILLANGANSNLLCEVSEKPYKYKTILGSAVDQKNLSIARLLLEHKADVNKNSIEPGEYYSLTKSNFEAALKNDDVPMMQLLLDYKADIESAKNGSKEGGPPLIVAVRNTATLDFLMRSGFDIDKKNFEGRTLLMETLIDRNPDINFIKTILKYRPNLKLKSGPFPGDNATLTALEIAELYSNKEVILLLKKAGAK